MIDHNTNGTAGARAYASSPPVRSMGTAKKVQRIDDDYIVGVGEYRTVEAPLRLMCIGLGSCVGIAIYDQKKGIGGLIHAMLPYYAEGRDKTKASKYADLSVMLMVDELVEMGADRSALRAKMAGGAQMFSFISSDVLNIGLRNSQSARQTLKKEKIPLLAEDIGGTRGRTVVFDPTNSSLRVQKGGEVAVL